MYSLELLPSAPLFTNFGEPVAFWLLRFFDRLREKALAEHFGQPVVGYFYPSTIISGDRSTHTVEFSTVTTDELVNFVVPLR